MDHESPRPQRGNSSQNLGTTLGDSSRWTSNDGPGGNRPPAPMGLSTASDNWRAQRDAEEEAEQRRKQKGEKASNNDSLEALMDVLGKMDRR